MKEVAYMAGVLLFLAGLAMDVVGIAAIIATYVLFGTYSVGFECALWITLLGVMLLAIAGFYLVAIEKIDEPFSRRH